MSSKRGLEMLTRILKEEGKYNTSTQYDLFVVGDKSKIDMCNRLTNYVQLSSINNKNLLCINIVCWFQSSNPNLYKLCMLV